MLGRAPLLHGSRLRELSNVRCPTASRIAVPHPTGRQVICRVAGKFTKGDLEDLVTTQFTLPKTTAKKIVDALLDTIVEQVSAGNEVALTGFGSFKAKERKARNGRNPQSGELMAIPAKTVPSFTAGKNFKLAVGSKAAAAPAQPAAAAPAQTAAAK